MREVELRRGERDDVASQRECVPLLPGSLGGNWDGFQRVVIRNDLCQGRGLAGQFKCVEDIRQSVAHQDRGVAVTWKCRCGPPDVPELPTFAMGCPRAIRPPGCTAMLPTCRCA